MVVASEPRSRQITTTTPHHSVSARWMLFLTPSQQKAEGYDSKLNETDKYQQTYFVLKFTLGCQALLLQLITSCCRQLCTLRRFLHLTFLLFQACHRLPSYKRHIHKHNTGLGWLGSRVVSVLDSGAEGPGFKSQPRHCQVTVLGKLFTPIVPLFTKQQNW